MTIIDIATTLLEIVRVETTNQEHSVLAFETAWLSRYPRPTRCLYDAAGCFTAPSFQVCLNRNAIQGVPITVKNPQANAFIERSHLTLGNMMQTYQNETQIEDVATATEACDGMIAATQRAIRAAVHSSTGVSPGAQVFGRDMLMNVPCIVDLEQMRAQRQQVADRNNLAENRRRRYKNYVVGDEVLIIAHKPTKMAA